MIYHLLPEQEAFSMYQGGAIAKNIANMMRFDASRIVVCQRADKTWGYESERILVVPELHWYRKLRGRGRIPHWITKSFFRYCFRPLLSILKDGDIVWCHNQPFLAAALERLIHLKGGKLIYHAHDGRTFYAIRVAFRSFTADAYIFVSDALRQQYLNLFPWLENTYVVYNGANQSLFYPAILKDSQVRTIPTILYIGRLHPEKGVHILMDAMRILQERNVNVLCKVIGSSFVAHSKATPYVKQLLKNQPPNVQFKGYRIHTEIAEEYRAADILCCPSICQEGFGNTNVEAMACGIPVVATNVGGIPEIAAEGGVLLIQPSSAVELADGLQMLIKNKELRLKVGNEGIRSFQRRFTLTRAAEQYQLIVENLSDKTKERSS